MSEPAYRVKPLEWQEDRIDEDDVVSFIAPTPFGDYYVEHYLPEERLFWGYCFDEYKDEEYENCESIEAGKLAAERHWRERIAGALEEVGE